MEEYYDKKIDFLYVKYKELFEKLLCNKNISISNDMNFFSILAYNVKKVYPKLQRDIDNICYMFNEKRNSEEKLEYLLNVYPIIMEELNGSK